MGQFSVCLPIPHQLVEIVQLSLIVAPISHYPAKAQGRHVETHLRVKRVFVVGVRLELSQLENQFVDVILVFADVQILF